MSIRIQNDGLAGTSASETGRTQDVHQSGGSGGRFGSQIGGSSDRVELSSLSAQIANASSASGSAQAGRVRQLAALYASGRYQADSMAVSRAMVTQTIQSGGLASD